ncbi:MULTISPECIES: DNA-directed RNA polymerase subunit beta [Staphylococcaceae]|uniref:DNA-directed RNA polymerase subunit beta n=25 Tax=Staphylococcus TaxID=1279 RepID=A0A8X8GT74_STAHO|nr:MULTISPECIES: DNA-directed RNA polymerase subunit beta [Staphylococcus]EUZ67710.1 DNA-directed RNA polymerase subunit beta [Staphylococcus sp. M0480]OFK84727.1 DNA-directed RNA polymerase subunit beta [Staphylococcus sp. HMSC057A02]OFM59463.1 DNA-directed RNA polymerase subunit beta [Staphylococcus sp. HMSC059G05]OFM60591.1 DNA-directed RNA polymerase subunit beta [Staphylococcus sp. HMSC062C01]OFM66358.1 DNA-directed RNA polymerase subunit beta [Staphylococcus sp. HMSC068D07]OFM80577.1 DN
MAGQVVQYGRHRKRRNYARISEVLELPNLIEIQTKSYDWFLKEGLLEMFRDISPIEDFTGNLSLEFVDYRLGEPKYDLEESKNRDATYAAPLRVKVRLIIKETGEVKEQEVFMGDFPLMTDTGTFVINGAERVIVSQLVRSPSVYFNEKIDKNGRENYDATIIPNRGAWLEYETDAKDIVYVRIDRTRKLPLTVLLRALGFSSDQEIIDLLGDSEYLRNTLEKDSTENTEQALLEIYERLRPGEPPTVENAKSLLYSRFFDPKRYDLASVGRYKTNKKLHLKHRLFNQKLAEPIVDSETGEIVAEEGTVLDRRKLDEIMNVLESNANSEVFELEGSVIDEPVEIQSIKVYVPNDEEERTTTVIGNALPDSEVKCITPADIIASMSYFFNLLNGIGYTDDIDHLGNRRLRSVGELLQNQFRIGLSRMERVVRERMSIQDTDSITPQQLINIRPVIASIKEFFGSSQLSQFMDQANPLAELTHKRRLSALGPGGLTRERAQMEVRDVHYSHYGRMCPIETPEGPNIGLINSLSSYARVNEFGFIETPYRKVDIDTNSITDQIDYLTADEEDSYVVAQANSRLDENGRFLDDEVVCRFRGNNTVMAKEKMDYMDVSPKQVVSAATACIPFLENDDSNRALMGANMQRQAVPLMNPEAPFVGTGMEHVAARDSGAAITAKHRGRVEHVESNEILVRRLVEENGTEHEGELDRYPLAKFKRSNSGTCYNQRPIVSVGDVVEYNEILADGPSMELGEMALGRNVVVGFMTWDGYNYEDAVIMSERLVKDDVYTSIHIEEYESEARDTKLGPEEITRDIPNVSENALKNLDDRGIIYVGAEVKDGDILVGKVTPKGVTELTAEERLLHAIFGEKAREVRDTSLRVPHGAGGIVLDVKVFNREEGDDTLSPGVNQLVRVYIVQKRKIHVGDKMCGRHGNKGVISKIVPEEDMPYLPDGRPIDIMLNPLGVPSRMNIGQVLELHLGMAAKNLGIHVASPVFDGANDDDVWSTIEEAGMARDGKTVLYDGRTGEPFDNRISVGVMYMLKLAHMVDDKLHARSTGPYSLVTQQPLGGKAQFGGQRFGEMEVWALEAYGAAYTLQEILTYKSDDTVGRVKTYESIVKGENISRPSVPESFRVLMKELQSLGLDVKVMDEHDNEIEMADVDDEDATERKVDLQQKDVPETQKETNE